VIEDGEVHVFDVRSGSFIPASTASHSGTGPYRDRADDGDLLFNEIQSEWPR
jgi:carbonic anhydrase